jgi:serine/threonine protein kinase
MEYVKLGSLGAHMLPQSSRYPAEHTQNTIKAVAKQLSEGLMIMHAHHIAHRDLNPNVSLKPCPTGAALLMIADHFMIEYLSLLYKSY